MKHYEVLFIVKPTLTEDEAKSKVDLIKEIITKNGGEVASVVEMGIRKLAYTIKKHERGNYFVAYFIAPPKLIEELVRNIRYNEDIIRYLVVKYEKKKEIEAWEKLSKNIKLNSIKKENKETKKAYTKKNPNNVAKQQEDEEKSEALEQE